MYWTGKGDDGRTKLYNSPAGCRIPKSSRIVEALGSLDEVNSYLGLSEGALAGEEIGFRIFCKFLAGTTFHIAGRACRSGEDCYKRVSSKNGIRTLYFFAEDPAD